MAGRSRGKIVTTGARALRFACLKQKRTNQPRHCFVAERINPPGAFLARLRQAKCRVAVLDVWMPDMNGLEVQAFLGEVSPKTRIIFISGRDEPSVRQTALDAGAFGFLAKPFEDEALIQSVRQALAGSSISNGHSGDMP